MVHSSEEELKAIIEHILQGADKDVKKVLRSAREECGEMERGAKRETKTKQRDIIQETKAEKENVWRTTVGGANLQMKKENLARKRELIGKATDKIRAVILDVGRDKYASLMRGMFLSREIKDRIMGVIRSIEAGEEEPVSFEELEAETEPREEFDMEGDRYVVNVITAKDRSDWLDSSMLEEMNSEYQGEDIPVVFHAREPEGGGGGFVLEFGPIEIDCTLDAMVSARSREIEEVLAAEMFSDTGGQ